MKIKVIERSLDDHAPAQLGAPRPTKRNLDPKLHPFARPREYQRALTASKLERMFAKPFVAALDGHADGVYAMARDPQTLSCVASGAGDGEVRVWSLSEQASTLVLTDAHEGMVRDLCFAPVASTSGMAVDDEDDEDENVNVRQPSRLLTCGVDRTVKLWAPRGSATPLQTWNGPGAFQSISHHRSEPTFATATDEVLIWDMARSEPILSLAFAESGGARRNAAKDASAGEHLTCVRFNQSETSVLAASGSDRTVCLFDARMASATSRLHLQMRVNHLSWNPLQPTVLLMASEDQNLYSFDVRHFKSAQQVYKGHVGAAMSCDWSPTGREFVSGSYDRTVRIWRANQGSSRDVYHTKRMQRVFSAAFTLDSRFVLSGSDDGNVRIWKARASDKLGAVSSRERSRREERDALRAKWKHVGDVAKIERRRFLPKSIHGAGRLQREMTEAERRRDEQRQAHAPRNRPSTKPKAERVKAIRKVDA